MSRINRYLLASQEHGSSLSLYEWRESERLRSVDTKEISSFADYLEIAQKALETFNKDNLYEDINQLQ